MVLMSEVSSRGARALNKGQIKSGKKVGSDGRGQGGGKAQIKYAIPPPPNRVATLVYLMTDFGGL